MIFLWFVYVRCDNLYTQAIPPKPIASLPLHHSEYYQADSPMMTVSDAPTVTKIEHMIIEKAPQEHHDGHVPVSTYIL